ncbi:MAG: filamentous hemagglutinin N-terminal domain-containing protein, partial [Candidatus Omnitrophica bacterium]|nr:filamentous hemagglutinin N-terminal domain-containing protein [Candidatus Omnitrophota bacterium]
MKAKRLNVLSNKLSLCTLITLFLYIYYAAFPAQVALGGDLPENPVVQVGAPTITSDGMDMTVNAGASDKTWIDWRGGFNIGANNSVDNIGPSASAAILHHDVSGVISNIQGALTGNCNVFLLNPSGVLFAPGAQVNVGGLVVSTLNMSLDNFKSGNYSFNSNGIAEPGLIVNAGEITATNPFGVTLMAGAVRNAADGVINANLGTVNLVSGSEVTLNLTNNGSIQAVVNKEVLNNVYDKDDNRVTVGVENVGDIYANGGQVFMEAEAVNDVFTTLINQNGLVKAGSMVNKGGKIVLVSNSNGIVQNTGTLNASAIESGAKGGTIEMRGQKVGQFSLAHADAIDGNGGNITLYGRDVVVLSPDSLTTANAGLNGDGGIVTVYSPDTALFWSDALIEAKGGTVSGDGGFVEVS